MTLYPPCARFGGAEAEETKTGYIVDLGNGRWIGQYGQVTQHRRNAEVFDSHEKAAAALAGMRWQGQPGVYPYPSARIIAVKGEADV